MGLVEQRSQNPLEELGTATPRGAPDMWSPVEGKRGLTWCQGLEGSRMLTASPATLVLQTEVALQPGGKS